ncbi:MAG: hypothetical protein AAF674_03180 [Pseudomonadota bacterium]
MIRSLKSVAFLAAVTVTGTMATPADAQMVCGQRDKIIAQLEMKYGETRRSVGLQEGRGLVEVFASEETGSWTILVTDPRGMSCLMAAGEAFQVEKASVSDTPT